jgi:hypothetical protein
VNIDLLAVARTKCRQRAYDTSRHHVRDRSQATIPSHDPSSYIFRYFSKPVCLICHVNSASNLFPNDVLMVKPNTPGCRVQALFSISEPYIHFRIFLQTHVYSQSMHHSSQSPESPHDRLQSSHQSSHQPLPVHYYHRSASLLPSPSPSPDALPDLTQTPHNLSIIILPPVRLEPISHLQESRSPVSRRRKPV